MKCPGFVNIFFKSSFHPSDGLPFWREKIFNGILLAFLIFGTIAIVPNLIVSIQSQLYSIFLIDLLFYLTILVVTFNRAIGIVIKTYFLAFSIYLLGIFLLVALGPFGPGLIWMVSGSVFIALMLDYRTTLFSIAFNFLIVVTLALLIHFNISGTPFFTDYKLFDWIAVGLNVVVLSSVCAIPIAILIQGLEKTLAEEKELKQELIEKNQQLSEEMVKAIEIDKLKSSFVANLSHEIRTPMNAIAGFSELIYMEENLPVCIKKYSEQIFINSDYLQNIINDIVDISLIEAGQIKIHNENFSPVQLINELSIVVDSLLIRKKKPHLEITYADESGFVDNTIYFDKNHLKQILINFITNSLKYTNEGFIEIGCKCLNKHIVFHVRDSGIGIPDAEKNKIFKRFSRIDNSLGLLIPGMGIGLSISKSLSDALGGEIWFESEKDIGSCFYFSFPLDGKG